MVENCIWGKSDIDAQIKYVKRKWSYFMWNKSIQEVFNIFKTGKNGLTQKEAETRIKLNGKNQIPKAKKETIFEIFIGQFTNPIVAILVIATLFAILTKSYADAIFILAVISINAFIGTYQEWNSGKSSEKLANMIKINTKVIRDGINQEIDSEDLVVGDIILLESGDKVPADLRIIDAKNLSIDESILTGESIPKDKDEKQNEAKTPLADRTGIAYAGSIVAKGRGTGIVIAVGKDTEFGKVADKVLVSEDAKSPLVIRMEKFIRQISIGFIILAIVLAIILFFKGYTASDIFSTVVALTISAIPEGLTIATTIVLSISSAKMAKKNVIVKKLNAVESLGSCARIATDKTGTLTANEQTAKKVLLPNGEVAYIKGVGYNDKGEVEFDLEAKESTKNLVKEIAKLGVLNNEASLELKNGSWVHHGDAIDTAFLALGYKMNVKNSKNVIGRIPYESKQKYSAVFYEENKPISKQYVTVKGAVEKVLDFCDKMVYGENECKISKEQIIKQAEELSKGGFRVIGIAKGENKIDTAQNDLRKSQDKQNYLEKDIPKLSFMGMVAFVDPIREDVIEAIQKCKTAGIKISMITGDHPLTAKAIAERLEIEDVHARVSPIEKLEIVENFKKNGEFVAVTGDGVNDTPALKAANIGIAMGSGSDIAKETGNMIIIDDDFSSIVKGVEEGRRAYNNIRKVIYLLLSTGFSEIMLFLLAIATNLPIPLVAIQLLWLNLISNGLQGDALAFEKDIEDVMNRKVKNNKEKIFNKLLVSEIFISSIVIAVIEFALYVYLIKVKNYDIVLVRTYLLTLMVFMENIHIFNCRSETLSVIKIPGKNNVFLISSIIATCIIQIIIVSSEKLASFFKLTTISINQIGWLFLLTIPVILVMEAFKKYYRRRDCR